MSAFLGPIHVKMYQRILYQDSMSKALLDLAAKNGWADGLQAKVDSEAPAASKEPLENIIDQSNIHGWLSQAVGNSENRFAEVVCGILEEDSQRIGELEEVMKELGRKYALPSDLNAEETYAAIHDILLDGMPCDFPFAVLEQDEDLVQWQVKSCPHARYWTNSDIGADTYYRLRDSWVEGVLENSSISYSHSESAEYSLRKEAR
ncbi:MAG: hypothetical protein QM793_03875 [Muricomes sp.]